MNNTDKRCAIITGIAGQDGSYLSEFLLHKGYHVYGMIRRNSSKTEDRLLISKKYSTLHLMYGDITDIVSIFALFKKCLSDLPVHESNIIEVYNLAAQSHVQVSFETPLYTCNADAIGVLNLFEVIVQLGLQKRVRIYQASTSEMFGSASAPQSEQTVFEPRSPYAISKLYSYWTVRNYREAYCMYAVNGILFNHESERRGETFVSRKITRLVATYRECKKHCKNEWKPLAIGNLYSKRDWGYAPEYVQAMWLMLQQDTARDMVIATGHSHSVKEFIDEAFSYIGVTMRWEGVGLDEKGYDFDTGELLVYVDPKFFRPTEVNHLQGDATLATQVLGWKPRITFYELVRIMVDSEEI